MIYLFLYCNSLSINFLFVLCICIAYIYSLHRFAYHLCIVFPSTDQLVDSKNSEDTDFNHSNLVSEQRIWWRWSDSPVSPPQSEELSQSLERITYPIIEVLDEGIDYKEISN